MLHAHLSSEMSPCSFNSLTCLSISASCADPCRYERCLIGQAPATRGMPCWVMLVRPRLNTSVLQANTFLDFLRSGRLKSAAIINSSKASGKPAKELSDWLSLGLSVSISMASLPLAIILSAGN